MRLSDRVWSDAGLVALLLAGNGCTSPDHDSAEYVSHCKGRSHGQFAMGFCRCNRAAPSTASCETDEAGLSSRQQVGLSSHA